LENSRNSSVDTFKFLAIGTVIIHHTRAFYYSYDQYGGHALLLLKYFFYAVRFGIPYFFISAGYFFGKSLQKGRPLGQLTRRYCGRLTQLFILWTIIYFFIPQNFNDEVIKFGYMRTLYWHFTSIHLHIWDFIRHHFITFLFTGSRGHLWFFPAYITGILILSLFLFLKKEKYLIVFGLILYFVSLLGRSYKEFPIGFDPGFEIFYGPFISTFFIAIGLRFSRIDFSARKNHVIVLGFILIFTGLIVQFAENWFLFKYYKMVPEHAFLAGMIPLGIGIFLLSMGYQNLGKSTIFPYLGRYTLGVFVLHEMFISMLKPVRCYFEPVTWDIAFPVIVFLLSLLTTMLLVRSPIGRILVKQQ